MLSSFVIASLGDQAFTITLGDEITEQVNQNCISLADDIRNAGITGVQDVIPAYNTISIIYSASQVNHHINSIRPSSFVRRKLESLIAGFTHSKAITGNTITVPVCFHPSFGFDIETMAFSKNISVQEIIRNFISTSYRVYMIGFLPGFAYMGKVSDQLATPRKEKPHLNIPAGSIGIAGNQTGIYPLNSPGGWNIIGRTPLTLFDASSNHPCLFKAGDNIIFQSIGLDQFHQLNQNH